MAIGFEFFIILVVERFKSGIILLTVTLEWDEPISKGGGWLEGTASSG